MVTEIKGRGREMLTLIEALDCTFGLERSAKFGDGEINEDRFLAILHRDDLGSDPAGCLARFAEALSLPAPMLATLVADLDRAQIVHFAHEGGKAGLFKIYLEFTEAVRQGRRQKGTDIAPVLVHLAVKWRPEDAASAALSRYIWPAEARGVNAVVRRLSGFTPAPERPPSIHVGLDLVDLARNYCNDDQILLMEVEEEGSPRRSFDVNVYSAGLPVDALKGAMRGMGRAYGIAPERVEDLLARVGGEVLGHVSGGTARNGRDFATLYYGAAPRRGGGRG